MNSNFSGKYSPHKSIFPLDWTDFLGFLLNLVTSVLASTGGVGGGGVFVLSYCLIIGFNLQQSAALSNITIFGGAVVNIVFNIMGSTPEGNPLIDWLIILMMEPSTIGGVMLGGILDKYIPHRICQV